MGMKDFHSYTCSLYGLAMWTPPWIHSCILFVTRISRRHSKRSFTFTDTGLIFFSLKAAQDSNHPKCSSFKDKHNGEHTWLWKTVIDKQVLVKVGSVHLTALHNWRGTNSHQEYEKLRGNLRTDTLLTIWYYLFRHVEQKQDTNRDLQWL